MLYQVSVSELNSIPKEITGPHYILQTLTQFWTPRRRPQKKRPST